MKHVIIPAAVAALLLVGCADEGRKPIAELDDGSYTTLADISNLDLDLIAFEAAIDTPAGREACDAIRAVPDGISTTEVAEFALPQFEKGYGQPLSVAATARFREFVRACR